MLLKTKLYKPRIPKYFIQRQDLIKKLNPIYNKPLTLVSAPSGYGKSLLISDFLDGYKTSYCWISLNESENNRDLFVQYLVAGIQKMNPEFGKELQSLIASVESAPYSIISSHLINSLSEIENDTIIVLDDFHNIHNEEVLQLINDILEYPPLGLHIIIITRRDPGLPIAAMRSKQLINEIRINDLKFDDENTTKLLQEKFDQSIPDNILKRIKEQFDGWIAGLNLLSISVSSINSLEQQLDKNLHDIILWQSLAEKLINKQPSKIQHCILSTALMDEFCAELIESFCPENDASFGSKKVGKQVIDLLQQSNMFIISLDDHNQWFRFHHLFQDILNSILHKTFDKVTIQQVHEKAANWFDSENRYHEAIDHFLKADKLSKAIQLFESIRKDLINNGKWRKYEQLFFKFDINKIANEPTLILANCWYLVIQAKYPAFFEFLRKVSNSFEILVGKRDGHKNMMGEWNVMLAYQTFLLSNDVPKMAVHAENALRLIDENNRVPIVYAVILKAMHLRIIGKTEEAISFYYSHLNSNPNSVLNSFLLAGLCYNHWMEFDLDRLNSIGAKLTTIVSENSHYMESYAQGYYFLGIAAYVQNDLVYAKTKLEEAYAHRYKTFASARIFTQVALAFTYCDLGNTDKAHTIIEQLKQNSIAERNDYLLNIANAAKAELYIRNGKVNEVIRWLKNYNPGPLTHSHGFYVPRITYIRALMITDGERQLEKALSVLEEWEQFLESVRARNFLVHVYTLKALALHLLKKEEPAILSLELALQLSQNSGAIRNFIDAGPKFVDWYNRIHEQFSDYPISKVVLLALNNDLITDSQIILSIREEEVLQLMALKLSNKEIGSRLFIAEVTVKRHVTNILKKLNTTNRKKAVVQALKIGILQN